MTDEPGEECDLASAPPVPQPLFDLTCHDHCPDGTFANISFETGDYSCQPCEGNTYSIGRGGIRIDGTMGAFNFHGDEGSKMPLRMSLSCKLTSPGYEYFDHKVGCTEWTRTGTSLKAYQATYTNVTVDFDITYPVFFDDVGTVEFKYRKDTVGGAGSYNGIFKFMVDDKVMLTDREIEHSNW